MKKRSLQQRLSDYLAKRKDWVASGEIQRLVVQETSYTPRTVVRRLQELVEGGELEVDIRKGHAWYRSLRVPPPPKVRYEPKWVNGEYRVVLVT